MHMTSRFFIFLSIPTFTNVPRHGERIIRSSSIRPLSAVADRGMAFSQRPLEDSFSSCLAPN